MRKQAKLILLLFCFTLTAFAQKSSEQMGAIYYVYPEYKVGRFTPVPDGFVPFYMSHYGRHGSRWLTSDARYEWIIEQFSDEDNLTKAGKKTAKMLQIVWQQARGNGGKLSPIGARQHEEIARRMALRFPKLFSSESEIEAFSSVSDRCVKSMQAFCRGLDDDQRKRKVEQHADSADMTWIAYKSPELEAWQKTVHPPRRLGNERFISALFKDPSRVQDAEKLMTELHAVASDMQDVGLKLDFYQLFTEEELRDIYEQNNLRMWLCNGQAPDNYGVTQRSAVSLWHNIKAQAERALQGNLAATLRFGHDTPLYRLLALLGPDNLSDEQTDEMDEVIPMAANLQIVFYYNPDKARMPLNPQQVIVKFMHNEREIRLFKVRSLDVGPDGKTGYYYRWDHVLAYVEKRIANAEAQGHMAILNTFVGTDYAVTPAMSRYGKGSEEHGQTLPAVLEPNGMTFWTPQTRDGEQKCVAPYYYRDEKLQGFRGSHWLVGGCTQDYGSFTVMPLMDSLRLKPADRATRFSHADEVSHPDYYAVSLPDEHLKAEMTGMSHAAMLRFTYQKDGKAYIVVNTNNGYGEGFVAVDTVRNCLYGHNPVHRIYQGWGEKAGFSGWFAVVFQAPLQDYGVKDGVAWAAFDVSKGDEIMVKTACSFVDMQGVFNNILQEIPHWEFNDTRARTVDRWKAKLNRVRVFSKDKAAIAKFYGALYRAAFLPRAFSDKDGRYPSFAGSSRIVQHSMGNLGGRPLYRRAYMDFSMWDIYRALLPLNQLIEPAANGMLQSLVDMYDEGGWLPVFPCWNSYTSAMIGDHASAALAEAIVKGGRNIDKEKAYEAMRKNAFELPDAEAYRDGKGRRAMQSYLKYGYIPLNDTVPEAFHTHEQVSRTLEYAYDDYAVAQAAKALGKTEDYQLLMARARNWRNVIGPTGWADGRWANGKWLKNRDLTTRVKFITEGTVAHYTWYVPHDVYGLMGAMGGKKVFTDRLDRMFRDSLYWHGNEPCQQIPYLYAYAGQPWKTQQAVRAILDNEYLDVPGGLSGNDDAGQMSAWYVLSALGFYPVCPASPYYVIGTPTFDEARIGRFTIKANGVSPKNCYIQSATYNGKPYTRNYLTHEMLTGDGLLEFTMGANPNVDWGSKPEDCPPDLMK